MKLSHKIAFVYLKTRLQLTALVSPQKAAQKAFTLFCTPRRNHQQPLLSAIIKNAELISFRMNNLAIRGYRWNHPSPKKILIAHGFESAARNFEGFIHPLINKGYEVIAFDAPAHGRSDGTEITLPVYVQTLQRVVSEYGPFSAYMAHSFGGLAITHLLEVVPHTEQTRVVLIAPATEATTAINGFFHLLHLNGKVKAVFDRLAREKSGIPPEHLSIRRAVQNIKANFLWLDDDQDDITPYHDVEKVKNDHHSNIEFIISSGLGHRKIYRDKHTLNHILHFL
ncbi:alpha/beta hydrolase [Agriterribacter sp.]|uniref:alpha/beta hydrolase n=1 Tax=Agriterribacter sp. TaxID=2821509 RepID=UPI002C1FB303|nr:alpha/beta fold hydrolase [Agriterribacter sp.]HTN07910.1 alpha/beta fold hydrolase [Agriterribacter sp.]